MHRLTVLLFASLFMLPLPADPPFKPGEVLEMRRWPEAQAERVQVVRVDSYGVFVKWLDVMGESYVPAEKLRRPRKAGAPESVREAPGAAAPQPVSQPASQPAVAKPAVAAPPPAQDGPPMSQQEILDYLKTRIGSDPWRHPKKAETVAGLAALIRKRGVNFRYQTGSDFSKRLVDSGGNESTIPFAIQDNFGPPNTVGWLHGTWNLIKIAPAVDYEKGGWIYRRMEFGATNGTLRIRPDGTYDWNGVKGKYRVATEDESALSYRGGGALILLAAKTGYDWIVLKDRKPESGDWIDVQEYKSRGTLQEHGTR
ncbi:MAG: hypothetical protein DIJKHBIC_04484 [Thermoanaerobaculia bacterium]|nr:hypothetical protein [Thermoanaerobaculia bacterium]